MAYLTDDEREAAGCPFCVAHEVARELPGLIVRATDLAYVTLNLYPYNNGHLLILPYRHVADLTELSPDEAGALMAELTEARRALQAALSPVGFNIGMNLGEAAGAGIPGHVHLHIVPRWAGDTNFMPVVADTKVMSETLEQTKQRLLAVWGAQDACEAVDRDDSTR